MLEPPNLSAEAISVNLQTEYGLRVAQLDFLPLGADSNTAVYRAALADDTTYFLKLRRGAFDAMAVTLPKHLSAHGLRHIIPPLTTLTGQLWAKLDEFTLILYPFIEGRTGYQVVLSERHWHNLGAALKHLHTASLPASLRRDLPTEAYDPRWRVSLKKFAAGVALLPDADGVALELSAYLQAQRVPILDLIERTERLARTLQTHAQPYVVCHTDLHAGNLLIDANAHLYIVDWDNPLLASKERDLMFIGGGQGFVGYTAQEETILFYRGYGETQLNYTALAYYRYERIIQDLAIYSQDLLTTNAGGADREQSLQYLMSNFLPGGPLEVAYQSEHFYV